MSRNFKNNCVVHCETTEQLKTVLQIVDPYFNVEQEMTAVDEDGDEYKYVIIEDESTWNRYKQLTCVSINCRMYGSRPYFEKEGYAILRFNEFMEMKDLHKLIAV